MTPSTAYQAEFARRFAERKKKQHNNGPCAAVIVDCDCDWCIRNDIERELRNWSPMEGTTPSPFVELMRCVQAAEKHVANAQDDLAMFVGRLRAVCPHLAIAATEIGGPHTRVCQHCGIQETKWYSEFKTLTAPGGIWYETETDKSKERRAGQAPTIYPLDVSAAFSFRRLPHLDVTEG